MEARRECVSDSEHERLASIPCTGFYPYPKDPKENGGEIKNVKEAAAEICSD
jgi:hypothetical protein